MTNIPPVVCKMILCNAVVPNAGDPTKQDANGIIHAVRSDPPGVFPVVLPVLCVYLRLTGGRGSGVGQVMAVEEGSGAPVFASRTHTIQYPPDPLELTPVSFRILNCRFHRPGLYWIQFLHDGRELFAEPLAVR